jgi:hypothetical protein
MEGASGLKQKIFMVWLKKNLVWIVLALAGAVAFTSFVMK